MGGEDVYLKSTIMTPLYLDVEIENQYKQMARIAPNDPAGSISNNNEDGTRAIYLFECNSDDSSSTIYEMPFGLDTETGKQRVIMNISDKTKWKIVRVLREGDNPLILNIKTDKSPVSQRIRFTHRGYN